MFGFYEIPLNIEKNGISISVEGEGGSLVYRRESPEGSVKKNILAKGGKLLINPVEPLIKPEELTPYFLVEFSKSVMIEPKAESKIYIKFPVEIGVFIAGERHYDILDCVTLMKQKLTLYGDASNGLICKYWLSDVYNSIPQAEPFHEGVIELNIINTTSRWIELTKAVFNAYGMKIYYGTDRVSMRANLRILGENFAEIDFIDAPIKSGMEKSLEHYTVRRMSVLTTKFVMEMGL
ncbi:MAG: DUF432 domain-containing protein [Candidatus Methanoperedenaceae archaeon]|nr:DUF432 domain-containing protein [Candidatus Methanoperedenaceae archaeon]MDW7725591.1 DUF432 domain-containing protein [Candidatus Methanoperedens sp.]